MREQKLKEYLENSLTVEEFMMDLENSQHKSGYDTTSFHIEQIEEGEFEITKSHLIKICDDFLQEKLHPMDVNTIAFAFMFSDYFTWNGESQDGKIISEIIYDWDNPEIGFDLTKENFEHWKEYLQAGKTDYFTKEELKKKFRGVKKNRMRRNGF